MRIRNGTLQTSLAIFLAICSTTLLGAVAKASPATAARKAPAPATVTVAVPPNWPWHSVVMKQFTGSPPEYTETGSYPKDLADYFAAFGASSLNPEGLNSFHIYLDAADYYNNNCPDPNDPHYHDCDADQAWSWTMTWLDSMLAECEKLGVTAIIGLHSVEKSDGSGYYDVTSPSFWENNASQLGVQVVKLINHLVANDPSASYAYDILPEPTEVTAAGTAEQPEGWWEKQKLLIIGIQEYDPGHWIVVKPGPYGGIRTYSAITYPCDVSVSPYFCPYGYTHLVYSIHVYDPHAYTHQGINGAYNEIGGPWPGTITYPNGATTHYDEAKVVDDLAPAATFLTHAQSPAYMYVGEFSAVIAACDSNVWLQNMVDIWENQMSPQWGWSYHSHGGFPGWSAHYTYTLTPPPPETAMPSITYSAPIPASVDDTARWQDLQGMFNSSVYASTEGSCDP